MEEVEEEVRDKQEMRTKKHMVQQAPNSIIKPKEVIDAQDRHVVM